MTTLDDLKQLAALHNADVKRVLTQHKHDDDTSRAAILFVYNWNPTAARWVTLGWWPTVEDAIRNAYQGIKEFGMNIFEVSNAFPYLDACMIKKDVTLAIDKVRVEKVDGPQGTEKMPVLYFKGAKRGLLLSNKTNTKTLVTLYGEETDHWEGQRVTLYTEHVRAFGEDHHVIRIRDRVPPPAPGAKRDAKNEASEENKKAEEELAIPFDFEPEDLTGAYSE